MPATWASALDRFARGVHRFRERVDEVDDRRLRLQLREVGEQFHRALVAARSRGRGVPGHRQGLAPAVRGLLRAGTLCAQATERVAAAQTAIHDQDPVAANAHLEDVRELVRAVLADLAADERETSS